MSALNCLIFQNKILCLLLNECRVLYYEIHHSSNINSKKSRITDAHMAHFFMKDVLGYQYIKVTDSNYCKSLKFCVGFISRILHMNCFCKIKYHANILAVHCNNVTIAKSAKLNSHKIKFMGKTAKCNTREI